MWNDAKHHFNEKIAEQFLSLGLKQSDINEKIAEQFLSLGLKQSDINKKLRSNFWVWV